MNDETVLIVGGGVAAGTAAATTREEGFDGRLVLVTDEPRPPYVRPPLSKSVLAGKDEPGVAVLHEPPFWDGQDVEVRTGATVVDLGLDAGAAALADGDEVAYDRLVYATGASARPTPLEDDRLAGVHTLRDVDDALALRAALAAAEDVAVVGASWIGLEVAAAARSHDCDVTVVGLQDQPLQAVLGEEVGRAFRSLHEDRGVEVRGGVTATRVTGEDRADGIETADGGHVGADVVVLGTGVHPNVELARRAGLVIDAETGGVAVDASLRASDDRVLAIGDVAAHDHPRLGRLRVEHVEVARSHGRTAGRVLAGQDVVHDGLPLFYSDQYDVGMEYVGHADPDASDVVVRGEVSQPPFVAFYLTDGVVRAGTHVEAWDATDVIRELIGDEVDADVLADTSVALEDLPTAAR